MRSIQAKRPEGLKTGDILLSSNGHDFLMPLKIVEIERLSFGIRVHFVVGDRFSWLGFKSEDVLTIL